MLANFMIALFRSILMFFIRRVRKKYRLSFPPLYSFACVLFLTIILWPNAIFDIGFYYTYVLTFFLIFCRKDFDNIFQVTIYCFIFSLPITIYLNFSVNLLSIIYSILCSFVVCYILFPFSFIAIFSNIADKILYKISFYFEQINLYLDRINYFRIIIPKISIYLVIIIYLIYTIYILFPNKYIFYLYMLILLHCIFNKYFDKNYYVYFLDVKQGDMAVLISSNFKSVSLIDTGGIVNDNYMKNNLRQFLYSIGVSRIHNLIITHGDFDHIGEAINLVNNFKVENVIFNCGEYNDLEQELIKVLDKRKIPYFSCIKELDIDKNKLYFLQTKVYDNENDNSNVIYTELDGYKFMFMGDASITTEKEILDKYNLFDIDVLKVGHHGSKTSSGKEFTSDINPRYSVISVGKNNRYGHPNKEVLNNLENSKIYRTDQDGSIMFKIKNNELKIETCSP